MTDSPRARWGSLLCSWIPVQVWHKLLNLRLILPYYHVVADNEVPHVQGLYSFRNVRQFKADLEFFGRHYVPVELQDVLDMVNGRRRLAKPSFMLSFDDGFREMYDVVAPILVRAGIPAVFFLISSAVNNRVLCDPQKKSLLIHAAKGLGNSTKVREASAKLAAAGATGDDLVSRLENVSFGQRYVLDETAVLLDCDFDRYREHNKPYLTVGQIRSLKRQGFAFGAHSVDHPLYSELDLVEQLRQTRESAERVSNFVGERCRAFAFPFRDSDVRPIFFDEVFVGGMLEVSFGTGGIGYLHSRRNLSRFGMERTCLPPSRVLGRQLGKAALRVAVGNRAGW